MKKRNCRFNKYISLGLIIPDDCVKVKREGNKIKIIPSYKYSKYHESGLSRTIVSGNERIENIGGIE